MINGLWFASIMSSLAATTWAITCLEWCALANVTKAEDCWELAEQRHRRVEAMERWRMGLIVAAIPVFLRFSLFLFLAGLWLRLRGINKDIGLVVGVPTLIMASVHVVFTLLPVFTDAPFSTSASEVIELVVHGIKYIAERSRFIRPPRLFAWVSRREFTWISKPPRAFLQIASSLKIPRLWKTAFTSARSVYRKFVSYIGSAWQTFTWFLPFIFPTYAPDPYPFNELNKLKFGPPVSNKQILVRALFWLMNTPLSREEVKDILKEFPVHYNAGDREPLDRSIIRLLVSSISSLLENNDISYDEEPIFHHCTRILAKEIEKVSNNGGDLREIYFWKSAQVLQKLLPHFRLNESSNIPATPSSEDTARPTSSKVEVRWPQKAVPALFICPLPATIKMVAGHLDSTEHLPKETLLSIVRGLHVATLVCSDSNQSIIVEIPDLGSWNWDSSLLDRNLERALLQFLQNLFTTLLSTTTSKSATPHPATIPSLVVSCLKLLDNQPDQYPPKVHNALCLLVALACRSDPLVFECESSFVDDLIASAEVYKSGGEGNSDHAKRLVARLRAIACGPKPLACKDPHPLTRLGKLFSGLHPSATTDKGYMKGFLDAYAATLEAVLSMNGPLTTQQNADCLPTGGGILASPFFTLHGHGHGNGPFEFVHGNPNCRLPYVYSLAIALPYSALGWNKGCFKVSQLLVNRNEDTVTPDRALDTNILIVALLGFATSSQLESMRGEVRRGVVEQLKGAIRNGTDWRTRWKSIYLIADIAHLLSKNLMMGKAVERFLTREGSKALKQVESQRVPSDWQRKKDGLRSCGLWQEVVHLARERGEESEGVYEWIPGRPDVPYLALYRRPPTTPQPILIAMRFALSFAAWVNRR